MITILSLFVRVFWYSIFFSLLTAAPALHYLLEINRNLGSYYFVIHIVNLFFLPLFFFYTRCRIKTMCVALLAVLVLQTQPLLPFLLPTEQVECTNCQKLKLLYINVLSTNQTLDAVKNLIQRENADVVGILEFDPRVEQALLLEQTYPYHYKIPRDDDFGIALYSRYPFKGDVVTDVGESKLPPVIITDVELGTDKIVSLALLHTFPPMSSKAIYANKLLVRRVATLLKHNGKSTIIMADFNATVHSGFYSLFQERDRYKSVFEGEGLVRTWNAFSSTQRFAIDHILYRGAFEKISVKKGEAIGSDHFPIIAELAVR